MPASVESSGTQSTTPGSDDELASLTGPAGGAHYALIVDVNALPNGALLEAYMEREVLAAGTQREMFRCVVARGGGSFPIIDSIHLRLPEGVDGTIGIRQTGGSSCSIPWAVERVDG